MRNVLDGFVSTFVCEDEEEERIIRAGRLKLRFSWRQQKNDKDLEELEVFELPLILDDSWKTSLLVYAKPEQLFLGSWRKQQVNNLVCIRLHRHICAKQDLHLDHHLVNYVGTCVAGLRARRITSDEISREQADFLRQWRAIQNQYTTMLSRVA